MTIIILSIIIGGAFGFALDRVGATNPGHIIAMLRLTRLDLMKTILLAIGISSVLMFVTIMTGILDAGNMSVKTAYFGVFIGGILLGVGFAISGYCPGTSLSAAMTGRKDAIFFILGGLVGAAAYMASYSWVASTGILDKILGGKVTLGAVTGTKYASLTDTLSGEWIGIILGLAFIIIAIALPNRLRTGE